jgi:hypothetical protein
MSGFSPGFNPPSDGTIPDFSIPPQFAGGISETTQVEMTKGLEDYNQNLDVLNVANLTEEQATVSLLSWANVAVKLIDTATALVSAYTAKGAAAPTVPVANHQQQILGLLSSVLSATPANRPAAITSGVAGLLGKI